MSRVLAWTRDVLLLLAGALFVAGAAGALWGFGVIGPGVRGEPTPLGVVGIAAMAICLVAGSLATRAPPRPARRGLAPTKREKPEKVEKPRRTPSAIEDVVLAEWTLAPDEWRAYNGQAAADAIRYNARWNALAWGLVGVVVPWLLFVRWELSAGGGARASSSAAARWRSTAGRECCAETGCGSPARGCATIFRSPCWS